MRLGIFIIGIYAGPAVYEKKVVTKVSILIMLDYLVLFSIILREADLSIVLVRMLYIPFGITICLFGAVGMHMLNIYMIRVGEIASSVFRFFGERSIEFYLLNVTFIHIWQRIINRPLFGDYGFYEYMIVIIAGLTVGCLLHIAIKLIYGYLKL